MSTTPDNWLTAEGCRQRRQRLLEKLVNWTEHGPIVLADTRHLMYLANCHIDPFSLGAGFGAVLLLYPNGKTVLLHDNRVPASVQAAHVDERKVIPWYDGQTAGRGPRQLVLGDPLRELLGVDRLRIHDSLTDPLCQTITGIITALRRRKDPDEIVLLRQCMAATEAGHAWARANVQPGMTELDVYLAVASVCQKQARHASIVYGDFAVSPGPQRRGGSPTDQVLQPGDLLILDYSVVIAGYRSDFTNTLSVGRSPSAEQQRLFDLCLQALTAGEKELRGGVECLTVYNAVRGVFEKADVAERFPHHAGHGLGLTHPEAPYFVRAADETLLAGDVVTLEPGLYVPDVGGMRIERNYLVTDSGYEKLSNHVISLT